LVMLNETQIRHLWCDTMETGRTLLQVDNPSKLRPSRFPHRTHGRLPAPETPWCRIVNYILIGKRINNFSDIMSPKGKIKAIYPHGHSSVYSYVCENRDGLFSVPVEWRYHRGILESEGEIIGRKIDYDDGIDPPVLRFLD
jgi:hypothetical protein